MNERLKQLAEQAGLKYHNWITNESNINDGDFKYPRLEDYEKFAELIVEECRYVMDCNKGSDQHTEWNRALFETSEKIKEHFGVEE